MDLTGILRRGPPWQHCLAFLLLLLATCSSTFFSTTTASSEGDALYGMMVKWNANFSSWRSGGDPCVDRWEHVLCSNNGYVLSLNVSNTGIEGEIPAEIGDLVYLEVLDLSNSNRPDARLPNNTLRGVFPDTLEKCTYLWSVNVSNIGWNTTFPTVVTRLSNLQELYMSNANLNGPIPDGFFDLHNLQTLFLGGNNLSGSLKGFSMLKNLVVLTVWGNNFNGTIPEELAELSQLEYFNCHSCNLWGALPESFSRLKLQNVTLHRNTLTGYLPDSWKNITTLQNLRLDSNFLSGHFSSWMFESWPKLDALYLSKNRLYGPMPDVVQLDSKHKVSDRMSIFRLDCNYLDGLTPCADNTTNTCSKTMLKKLNASDDSPVPFDFTPNCFSDSKESDFKKVRDNCGESHPTGRDCSEIKGLLISGCLPCPGGQDYTLPGGRCICGFVAPKGSGRPRSFTIGVAIGAAGGMLFFFFTIWILVFKRRKVFSILDIFNIYEPDADEYWEAPSGVQRFALHELAKITGDFSDESVIGSGGFGKVFVGTLNDGRMVAIKRASAGNMQGMSEFRNEVDLLSRLHHRHLVKLEGFCDEGGFQILVYEYMKKGNLQAHLLKSSSKEPLHWYTRMEIAQAVAQGLEYLHTFADPPVIHRDVKPSNILLDENMVAKLADFGISKEFTDCETHVSTRPAGTAGYLDPDYFLRRQLTTASDVYAFGVVLLELVTGQEAIDQTRLEDTNLPGWVRKKLRASGILAIVDPNIAPDCPLDVMTTMAELGLQCSSFEKIERPSMKAVLAMMEPYILQNLYAPGHKKGEHVAFDAEDYDGAALTSSSDVGQSMELMSDYIAIGPR